MNDIDKKQKAEVLSYLETHYSDTDCMERDRELEQYLILKSKVELKLLMKLEAQVFDAWYGRLIPDFSDNAHLRIMLNKNEEWRTRSGLFVSGTPSTTVRTSKQNCDEKFKCCTTPTPAAMMARRCFETSSGVPS